jgi:hypothetical protein
VSGIPGSGGFGQVDREILKEYPNPKETLIKFILPADKMRETGMHELYRMNITQATLFRISTGWRAHSRTNSSFTEVRSAR